MATYPLFHSITNCIKSELRKRKITTTKFRTWEEARINAAGLEIEIDLSEISSYIKHLQINFDWDIFREASLAKQLKGLEEHPLLRNKDLQISAVKPGIDIEIVWLFDDEKAQEIVPSKIGKQRLDYASEWMEQVSKNVNELLFSDDIITRWHIEVEGDEYGRYLSAINLLSYFYYSFEDLKQLNEVHNFISRRLQHLLFKTNKVITLSDNTIQEIAA